MRDTTGFCAALSALDRGDDLPRVLLHNDCHPGNAITAPTGEVALIDWEGAGVGPAIIDLGFLLSSCDTPTELASPDPRRVAAMVAGYRHYRRPTGQELARLPAAIRFRADFRRGQFRGPARSDGRGRVVACSLRCRR